MEGGSSNTHNVAASVGGGRLGSVLSGRLDGGWNHPTTMGLGCWGQPVLLREAVLASRHEPGTAREGLIVEARVWHGPIQVFSGQHFPAVLPVVCDPSGPLVAVSRIQDGGLVRPQLGGLLRRPRNQDCCHTG